MTIKFTIAGIALAVLVGCSGNSSLAEFEVPNNKQRLDSTTVEIDGESYVVRQNRLFYPSGRQELGWAIETEGRVVSCANATVESCRAALAIATSSDQRDEGMGY